MRPALRCLSRAAPRLAAPLRAPPVPRALPAVLPRPPPAALARPAPPASLAPPFRGLASAAAAALPADDDDRPFSPHPPPTPAAHAGKLLLTDRAARRIELLNEKDGRPDQALRVVVEPGGCHGFQYRLELDGRYYEDDVVFGNDRHPGGRAVIDETSLDLVKGSKLDWVDELIGSKFALKDNPNADSGCGCGTSFNVKI
ncbi:hypothetical protein DFJ74DRAFT_29208 [Hyaloraphidium curvatum]|nr:hypothetical protein DFJ74DRAFT_29208 [Hyaloraphidium curvatum]